MPFPTDPTEGQEYDDGQQVWRRKNGFWRKIGLSPVPAYDSNNDGVPDELATALDGRYAPLQRTPGGRWAFLGDSITNGSTAPASAKGFAWFAPQLSGGRIRRVATAGFSGGQLDDIQPLIASTVIPSAADTCFVLAGVNDAAADVPIATFAPQYIAILDELTDAGIVPVVGLITPGTGSKARAEQYNAWLAHYCNTNGIVCVDLNGILANTANGNLATAYDAGDGVHPNGAGHMLMAQTIVNAVSDFLPPASTLLSRRNDDPFNLIENGLNLTDTDADGLADPEWTTGTVTPTYSLVTDPGYLGNGQKMSFSNLNGYRRLQRNITTGFSPGDTLHVSFVFTLANITGTVSGFTFDRVETGGAGTTVTNFSAHATPISNGLHEMTFVVPTGVTSIALRWVVATSTGSTCDLTVAQLTCRNLTALGLA